MDVVNTCHYCELMEWAEGTAEFPCQAVCPEDAILTVPEGEGEAGYYGMGYKWIDQEKCTKCGICFEVCPDRFSAVVRISGEPVPPPASGTKVVRKHEG